MLLLIVFLAVIAAVILFVRRYYEFVARYPKGPWPMPIVGHIHLADLRQIHRTFEKISDSKKHGSMFTMFIPIPFVTISSYDLLKEAFVDKGEAFSGRPDGKLTEMFSYAKGAGVINSTGDVWRVQRRAALSILRDFGMGKNLMEHQVRSSITEFLSHLDKIEDLSSVDLRWSVQVMVANIINETLFGYRYGYDECDELIDYVENFNKFSMEASSSFCVLLGMAFPFMRKLPYVGYYAYTLHKENITKLNTFIDRNVAHVLSTYDDADEPQCFVQAYKQRIAFNDELNLLQLHATCSDFFMAGQETTSTTLRWAALIMATHQREQEQLREEIHFVVGRDRLPEMADRQKMPYTQAFILELQRYVNLLALNLVHVTTMDTEIGGQEIPEGTFINGDLHYILSHDPLFEQPNEFKPERYLMDDGKTLNKVLVEGELFSASESGCAQEKR